MVAETNLAKYEKIVTDRRKHYYEIFEKCWYLDRKLQKRDRRRKAAMQAHQVEVLGRQQTQAGSR